MRGAIFNNIDVAQVVLYMFFIFFAGLVMYLRREDKREGYPLESERSGQVIVQGFPELPAPKTYKLAGGGTQVSPRREIDTREIKAVPSEPWPGAPLQPTGDPMIDGVGPAAYAMRSNSPDMTFDGHTRIVPLRVATTHHLESRDPDPRGMKVIGADGRVGGTVTDAWVDRSECLIRYLEVEVADSGASARRVLLPINFTRIDGRKRQVNVRSILAKHFANVPTLANNDQVTRREEDRICAYYGGGQLYALPGRSEAIL